jgi:hypothetical protein
MAFFQTVQDFVTWKKQGKLPAFKPEGFDQIMPNFRDENSTYMALRVNALTYAYNISKVRAEDAPKSAQDFLKPMFAGKVITVYPADDDATLYLFHLIVQQNSRTKPPVNLRHELFERRMTHHAVIRDFRVSDLGIKLRLNPCRVRLHRADQSTNGLMNSGRPGLDQVGMNIVDRFDLLVEFGPS